MEVVLFAVQLIFILNWHLVLNDSWKLLFQEGDWKAFFPSEDIKIVIPNKNEAKLTTPKRIGGKS